MEKNEQRECTTHMSFKRFDFYMRKIKQFIISFVLFLLIGFIFICGLLLGYFASIVSDSNSLNDHDLIQQVTRLPELNVEQPENTDFIALYNEQEPSLIAGPAEVSPYVTKALVASEDADFYVHNGVLPKAILRAMFQDIFDTQFPTGGSTITQQLVKNQILTKERTYDRKAKEIMYALRIEHILSKDEIIYTYLNLVPFGLDTNGQNVTGITSASYGLFGKPPKTLNLAEAAYLVGLLQSPYAYTPFNHDGTLKDEDDVSYSIHRQHYVLKRMLVEKKISKDAYTKALNYDIYEHLYN
ncbi:biosynthetic peptidoglycan transglycosylase [Staphylococcus intermedius]|uniref:Putative transglycosylase n=1 Tax=Staphylococcus intermedius NCTC 11048 TaxID=1141106 RepID=A0A380G7G2_STAIN|nr:biosynthetic peptidoglycan transglycosylase [Staphylococcus intermedius]PCF64647.1 transglycosylase [Staphylococcus intermedius]PCF80257.1 transglycosylase [Staphylococcus intermedius]PCF81607.1 transglycosylase [Staphylococcus intermedius]PCF87944.1 transglycosylase [Staphylococcus intermedius]PCF88657.1 transglycosylase [Staphylococcus intermedius]